ELLRCIGRGSYGEVWLARNILGNYRALKIIEQKAFRAEERLRENFRGFDGSNRYRKSTMALWRSCTWAAIAGGAFSITSWSWPTMTQTRKHFGGLNLMPMCQKH